MCFKPIFQPSVFLFYAAMYKELNKTSTGRLNNGVPQVPPPRGQSDLNNFRQTLPVYTLGEEIIKTIHDNKVVLVSGETGSGKTTQVGWEIFTTGPHSYWAQLELWFKSPWDVVQNSTLQRRKHCRFGFCMILRESIKNNITEY